MPEKYWKTQNKVLNNAHAETRDGGLARVLLEAKRCQTKVQSLEPKLADLENTLELLHDTSADADVLEKQSKDAKVLRKDADGLATLNKEITQLQYLSWKSAG